MGPKRKQNISSRSSDSDNFETFSPVKVQESSALSKQGNLTGSARKLKDGAADLHNLMQKWNVLNVDGANVVNDIANIKLECILGQPDESSEAVEMLPETLSPLCDKLSGLLHRMGKIVNRLTGLTEMSNGISKLEQHNQPDNKEIIIFQTWDVTKFESVFKEVTDMYQKELKLKQSIAENVCHAKQRDMIMFYTAAWLHQPYIDFTAEMILESVLLETKHKT